MVEKTRRRLVSYGGTWRPRNTSKFKDNSSEDNLPGEEIQKDEVQVRGSETYANTPRAPSGPRADILGPRVTRALRAKRPGSVFRGPTG